MNARERVWNANWRMYREAQTTIFWAHLRKPPRPTARARARSAKAKAWLLAHPQPGYTRTCPGCLLGTNQPYGDCLGCMFG